MARRPQSQATSQNVTPSEQALTTPEALMPLMLRQFKEIQEAQSSRQEMIQIHRDIAELKVKLDAVCKQSDSHSAVADELKEHRTTVKTTAAVVSALFAIVAGILTFWIGPEISTLRDYAHKLQADEAKLAQPSKTLPAQQ